MPLARLHPKQVQAAASAAETRPWREPCDRMLRRQMVHDRRVSKRELRELAEREAWTPSTTE